MSTITSLTGTDGITTANSMTKINTNFSNLNTDKIETSYLDTDTSLAANSDSKIATQKAVKAYVDGVGVANASTTARGVVEEATQAEVNAGSSTGGTGASLFVNPSSLSGYMSNGGYLSKVGTGATTYDMTTASGSQTIAHGLATTPRYVCIRAIWSSQTTNGSSASVATATAIYSNSAWVYLSTHQTGSSSASGNSSYSSAIFALYKQMSAAEVQSATLAVDATNITFTWTKTSTPIGTAYIVWEAFA